MLLAAWEVARDPEGKNAVPAGSPEHERRYKLLYDLLRARDEANSATEMAEIAARKAAQKKQKPARAGG